MKGRTQQSEGYRYGFNGKEDDTDFGNSQLIQDYGFRLYNPSIAKFLSVDPLTSSYPMLTPYQFASNTPVAAIDLDGLEGVKYTEKTQDENGNTKIIKITYELDVYLLVGTAGDYHSSFMPPDVDYIQDGFNSIAQSKQYLDPETGAEVVFKFNVQILDYSYKEIKKRSDGSIRRKRNGEPRMRVKNKEISINMERYKLARSAKVQGGKSYPALVAEQSDIPGTDGGKASSGIKVEPNPDGGQIMGLLHEIFHFMLSNRPSAEGDDHNLGGVLGRPYTSPSINDKILRELKKYVPEASSLDED